MKARLPHFLPPCPPIKWGCQEQLTEGTPTCTLLIPADDLGPRDLGDGPFHTFQVIWEGSQEEVSTWCSFCGSDILDLGPLGILYF